jgi:hypothetical protein
MDTAGNRQALSIFFSPKSILKFRRTSQVRIPLAADLPQIRQLFYQSARRREGV